MFVAYHVQPLLNAGHFISLVSQTNVQEDYVSMDGLQVSPFCTTDNIKDFITIADATYYTAEDEEVEGTFKSGRIKFNLKKDEEEEKLEVMVSTSNAEILKQASEQYRLVLCLLLSRAGSSGNVDSISKHWTEFLK